jgi:glycosyltransferase involved in cell wall biosynthesis
MTYNWGASDAIWLGRAAGIRRVIHSEHGFNVDEARTTHRKRDAVRFLVYRLASRVIVVSTELQTLLQRRYLLKAGDITHIPNGIDSAYYSPDREERQRMRKMLGFADRDIVVGFTGRLDPVKNLNLLLEIFAHCVQECSHLRLLLVGDGPQRQQLETFCQKKELQNQVVFAGQREDVLSYLRAMDLFLLTSLREQMPMTVLEAMAVGIPVVATKVGEIPHIIDNGIDGYVLDMDAPVEAFVQSLFALLSGNLRRKMGESARQKIIGHFQEQAMVRQYRLTIQGLW